MNAPLVRRSDRHLLSLAPRIAAYNRLPADQARQIVRDALTQHPAPRRPLLRRNH